MSLNFGEVGVGRRTGRSPTSVNLVGHRFERLTALERIEPAFAPNRRTSYKCACDCGNELIVRHTTLLKGNTRSCGCLERDLLVARNVANSTHGDSMKKGTVYHVWAGIHQRCSNPKAANYDRYGGRGIKVCERWNDYETFRKDMGSRPAGFTIERENNDGDYEPSNCIWADMQTQGNNKSTNRPIEFRGVTKNIKEWASEIGVSHQVLNHRIKAGWSIDDALTTPLNHGNAWIRGTR